MSSLSLSFTNFSANNTLDNKIFDYNLCEMYLLDNQDLSETTIKSYQTYLKQFDIWLKGKGIKTPTEDTIKEYKLYLKNNNNLKINKKDNQC